MQASLSFLALALFLVPWSARQDAGDAPKLDPRAPHAHAASEAERIQSDLCGAWELTQSEVSGRRFSGPQCAGFLVVAPGYCSLQARLSQPVQGATGVSIAGLTAGTYRWSYDTSRLTLALTTLMHGSDMQNDDGQIDYEPTGTRRDYEISLAANDLILTKSGGSTRMYFRRMPSTSGAKLDPKAGGERQRR